jgi:hypothetical protein
MRKLITISVKVYDDQHESFKVRGINISDWIRNKMDEEGLDLSQILEKIKIKEKELKDLTLQKEVITKNMNKFDTNEIREFFKDCKIKLKDHPEYLEGMMRRFTNLFGERINKEEFIKRTNGI